MAGGAGIDTIEATELTYTAGDTINGGGGDDTLVLSNTAGRIGTGAGHVALSIAGLTSVESLVIHNQANAVLADVRPFAAMRSVTVHNAAASNTQVHTEGNARTVSVQGGQQAEVIDQSGADVLESVTLSGNTGAASIASDALTRLSLASSGASTVVNAAAGTRHLVVELDGMLSTASLQDATTTQATLRSTGAASSLAALQLGNTTALTIEAHQQLSIGAAAVGSVGVLAQVQVSGNATVAISSLTGATGSATTLIDATSTGASGGLRIGNQLGNGVQFKGGAGSDALVLGATTQDHSLGGGNDRLQLNALPGAGGSIDAGAGTGDTLALAAAHAGALSAAPGIVSGFEVVELSGAATAAVALQLENLGTVQRLRIGSDVGHGLTASGMASGGTVEFQATQTASTIVQVTGAALQSDDSLAVRFDHTLGLEAALTAHGVETITVHGVDTTDDLSNQLTLTADAVRTLNVSGDNGFRLNYSGTTLTRLDASGVTAGIVFWDSGAVAAPATVIGGQASNWLNLTSNSAPVTYQGSANGFDTVQLGGAHAHSIDTGAGNDEVYLNGATGSSTVSLGTGVDRIDLGVGSTTVMLGADTDGDSVWLAVTSGSTVYATIAQLGGEDRLYFINRGTETFRTAPVVVGGGTLQQHLNAATAGDGSVNARIAWFQWGGDTWLAQDLSAATSFVDGADLVVRIAGLVDFSGATLDNAGGNSLQL